MRNDAQQTDIAAYLESLVSQRKLSAHTVSNYARDLAQLRSFADATSLESITTLDIRRFTAKLHAGGLGPRSIARKLSAWRGFYHWLSEHITLTANPVDGIKPPKRPRPLPKALAADTAIRLVSSGQAMTQDEQVDADASRQCNRAMFELLYSSGLRVSELVALDVRFVQEPGYRSLGWIDFEAHDVFVTGKGSKMRSVPVGAPAMQAIAAWLAVRETQLSRPADLATHRHALFVTSRGTRMSARLVQLRLKSHAQQLGIPVNVHPHVLRHSFASHVLQSSGDLRAVQEMLGHASITSTQIYTALDFQRLAQVYDAAHPRAKKK